MRTERDLHRVALQRIEPSLLLPRLVLYAYTFCGGEAEFRVVIDTDETTIERFAEELEGKRSPVVPNRALPTDETTGIDVSKFNSFLGPMSDFHLGMHGVYVPYTLQFFRGGDASQLRSSVRMVFDDLGGIRRDHDVHDRVALLCWSNDCIGPKTTVQHGRRAQSHRNTESSPYRSPSPVHG